VVIGTAGKAKVVSKDGERFKIIFVQDGAMATAYVLNFVTFFWFVEFIFACQHFVVAGTVCKWYFIRDKTKLCAPIKSTFGNLLNYHLGSLCLGSMLITLVKILRIIMQMLVKKLSETKNAVGRFVGCLCSWLLEKLEEIMQYIVRNAYIVVARDGTPFFKSAKKAFGLLMRNIMDVIALNKYGDAVLIFGRLFVTAIAGLVGFVLMVSSREAFFIF
jgi:solute carrier family 44 protein 1 (choline transporter-like protein)